MADSRTQKRIAAALVAGVGLGLLVAGLGIMGWWSLSVRERPLQVVNNPAPLEALLEAAPYISLNRGERPVYIIAPRNAPQLEQWLLDDAVQLAGQGREVRVIMLASGHGGTAEDATVAELWMSRDIDLLGQWLSMRAEHWTAIGIEPIASSPQRLAIHAEAAALARTLMQQVGQGAKDDRWPLIVWRDGADQLAACLCQRPAAVREARHALRLSDMASGDDNHPAIEPGGIDPRLEPTSDDYDRNYPSLNPAGDPPVPTQDHSETGEGTQYRTPSPLLPGDVGERVTSERAGSARAEPAAGPRPQPARPKAPPREINTAPPKAEKDAESLFY